MQYFFLLLTYFFIAGHHFVIIKLDIRLFILAIINSIHSVIQNLPSLLLLSFPSPSPSPHPSPHPPFLSPFHSPFPSPSLLTPQSAPSTSATYHLNSLLSFLPIPSHYISTSYSLPLTRIHFLTTTFYLKPIHQHSTFIQPVRYFYHIFINLYLSTFFSLPSLSSSTSNL